MLVGESHTSVESHRVELQVIRALHDAGRHVTIALEMFPYTGQAGLDGWNGGWNEEEFLTRSHWYDAWGYHWGYYREIFNYARGTGMKFVAANAPREVVTAVRQKGLSSLPADQAAHLPPSIDTSSDEHMTFFKASFDDDDAMHGGMTDAAWKGMLAAQATWDGAMAWNAVKAFEQVASDPQSVVVVLVGSGHVAYGLGIERQARAYFHEPIASVIGMPIADEHGPIPVVRALVRELHLGHGAREGRRLAIAGPLDAGRGGRAPDGHRRREGLARLEGWHRRRRSHHRDRQDADRQPGDAEPRHGRLSVGRRAAGHRATRRRRADRRRVAAPATVTQRRANVEVEVSCPYCGEPLTLVVDETGGRTQSYVEDCAVCCQPISVHASVEDDEAYVQVARLED